MIYRRVLSIRLPVFTAALLVALIAGIYLGIRATSRSAPTLTSLSAEQPIAENSGLASFFTPEVLHWSPLIKAWGLAYRVDPNLVATVIQIESCGDPNAISTSGAQGLFQVMPFHFTAGETMRDVSTNGRRGMEYLAQVLQAASGDAGLALAGYNGGQSVISKGWVSWSAETRRYYQWGVGIYNDAVAARTASPTLQAWLQAGGQHLCQSAEAAESLALSR